MENINKNCNIGTSQFYQIIKLCHQQLTVSI